ncbi:hypothetical protein [Nocardia lijiangensis]|uniref:hypothetical protein n=1 Tax=Nocardia lijiangensis TaxID=299618 RepID=UPI0008301F20|nr:hypothetical protein [Nocardia lijiangensis]
MEHGQQGAESVGAILSGIAELLRDVSDRLDSVAARVGEDNGAEARLKKLEAWAFRTEQNVSALETRLDDVTSVAPAERTEGKSLPSRAERRAAATPAAQPERAEPVRPEPARPEPLRSEPLRSEPLRSETVRTETARIETPRAERRRPPAPTRQEPASESPRTDSLEVAAVAARVEQQSAAPNGLPRREPATASPTLHDWVEPNVSRGAPYDAAPEPVSNAHAEPAEITPRTETPPERLDYGSVGTPLVDTAPRLNGRLEAPTLTSHSDTNLTAPREESAAPTQHRATIEDNSHVDKLQAMLDELKRNPAGPFGRPLSAPPGEQS